MQRGNGAIAEVQAIAGLITREKTRELFFRFCNEIIRFSDRITIEAALFEVRFSGPGNFSVTVSSYRELFLVSIGKVGSCDVRVSAEAGFLSALDLSLHHYLESQSRLTS